MDFQTLPYLYVTISFHLEICFWGQTHPTISHIKVELGSVKLAHMRILAGPVSIHNFFFHLLSATGAIVNVD